MSLTCTQFQCDEPSFRIEALQGDGRWVPTGHNATPLTDSPLEDDGSIGTVRIVGETWSDDLDSHPGTYRAVALVEDETGRVYEVVRELSVVGWHEEVLMAATEILEEAEDAECLDLRRHIMSTLIDRLEPDALSDLRHLAQDQDERQRILLEMLNRGSFVDELFRALTVAPLDDVRTIAYPLSGRPAWGQEPVRVIAAERLFSMIADFDEGPVEEDYEAVVGLESHWPDEGAAVFVERLAYGNEQGEALIDLIETTTFVDRSKFSEQLDMLVDVLQRRCTGSSGQLAEACKAALSHFTEEWYSLGLFGRASSACGGAHIQRSERCVAIAEAWERIAEDAGPLEVRLLSVSSVTERVTGSGT